MINCKELIEAEAIHREDALKRIAAMIRRYELTQVEVLQVWGDAQPAVPANECRPRAKAFAPIFDA